MGSLTQTTSVISDAAMHQKQPCQNSTSSQQVQHNRQPPSQYRSSFPSTFHPVDTNQTRLSNGVLVRPRPLTGGTNNLYHAQKKPRLDTRQQFQQCQSPQQQQRNHCMQQKSIRQVPEVKRAHDGAVYTNRLMKYMHHQRNRPLDNNIDFWRQFVEEYWSPNATKRCCFAMCNDAVEDSAPSVSADQATTGSWICPFCRSESGRRSEAVFENLPSLFQLEYGSGVLDEMLSLELLHKPELRCRIAIVEYGRAISHKIYRESRVVREGFLRVAFTENLKILSWRFCIRSHEEFVPCRLLKPVVNDLVTMTEYCQSLDAVNDLEGKPEERLQATNQMLRRVSLIQKIVERPEEHCLGFPRTDFQRVEIYESADQDKGLDRSQPVAQALANWSELQKQKMLKRGLRQTSAQGAFTNLNMMNNSTTMHSDLNTPIESPSSGC